MHLANQNKFNSRGHLLILNLSTKHPLIRANSINYSVEEILQVKQRDKIENGLIHSEQKLMEVVKKRKIILPFFIYPLKLSSER